MLEKFEKIVGKTGGKIKYIEQLNCILMEAGFTLDESEQIRKAFAKKQPDAVAHWKEKILSQLGDEFGYVIIHRLKSDVESMYSKSHETLSDAIDGDTPGEGENTCWILVSWNNVNEEMIVTPCHSKHDAEFTMMEQASKTAAELIGEDVFDDEAELYDKGYEYESTLDLKSVLDNFLSGDKYFWAIKNIKIPPQGEAYFLAKLREEADQQQVSNIRY